MDSRPRSRYVVRNVAHRLKRVAVWLCDRLGVFSLLLWSYGRVARKHHVIVLAYHHISTVSDRSIAVSALEHGTPVETLDMHLECLKRWYSPISIDELQKVLDGEVALSSDRLLVTFDDAYKDNLSLGAGVLRRHRIPALIFVPTGFIDSPRRFWWSRVPQLLRNATDESQRAWAADKRLPEPIRRALKDTDLQTSIGRNVAWKGIAPWLEQMPDGELEIVLKCLEEQVVPSENNMLALLSWTDIRSMYKQGFHFGGHTHCHPKLTEISNERIRNEVQTCHQVLSSQLGHPPSSFAYPAGAHNSRVLRELMAGPFTIAFTTRPGLIDLGSSDPLALPRNYFWQTRPCDVLAAVLSLKLRSHYRHCALRIRKGLCGNSVRTLNTEASS